MAKKLPPGFQNYARGGLQYRFQIDGKRYSVYGRTVKECREKELKKRLEIEKGTYKSGRDQTCSEYFEKWQEARRGTVKETTLRVRNTLWNRISAAQIDKAGHTFGSLKLSEVETQNVRDLQKTLSEDLSTRTVNESISLLNGMYRTAIQERIVDWNPCGAVRRLQRTEAPMVETIHRALTIEETKAFLKAAEDLHSYYLPLYRFLLNTGCRVGEAGAIKAADIGAGAVQIRRTLTRTESGGYMIGKDTKTAAGVRKIPLRAEAKAAIRDQRRNVELCTGVLNIDKPIFLSPRGTLLKSEGVNRDMMRICKAAEIEYFSVHAFRDTFATRCIESGMQPKTLMDIMGHSDINMTFALYGHVLDNTKEEQLLAVNFG